MVMLRRLVAPTRLTPLGWALATVAALAVGVGGYFHGHLFHEGYAHAGIVGPLFFLNVLASAVVVLALIARRVLFFLLGALGVSVGSLVAILISHSTSFFGFAEHRFDSRAVTIVVAEIVATLAALALVAIARRDLLDTGERA